MLLKNPLWACFSLNSFTFDRLPHVFLRQDPLCFKLVVYIFGYLRSVICLFFSQNNDYTYTFWCLHAYSLWATGLSHVIWPNYNSDFKEHRYTEVFFQLPRNTVIQSYTCLFKEQQFTVNRQGRPRCLVAFLQESFVG